MNDIQIAKEIREAIKKDSVSEVTNLLQAHPEHLRRVDVFGTCLHIAAQYGAARSARKLVELGADVNRRAGLYDANALKPAAAEGHMDVVKLLIDAGAEMDVSDPLRNPLFGAILASDIEIAKLLVERGIDIRVKYTGESMKNMDAYAFALERGELEIAELLKESLSET